MDKAVIDFPVLLKKARSRQARKVAVSLADLRLARDSRFQIKPLPSPFPVSWMGVGVGATAMFSFLAGLGIITVPLAAAFLLPVFGGVFLRIIYAVFKTRQYVIERRRLVREYHYEEMQKEPAPQVLIETLTDFVIPQLEKQAAGLQGFEMLRTKILQRIGELKSQVNASNAEETSIVQIEGFLEEILSDIKSSSRQRSNLSEPEVTSEIVSDSDNNVSSEVSPDQRTGTNQGRILKL